MPAMPGPCVAYEREYSKDRIDLQARALRARSGRTRSRRDGCYGTRRERYGEPRSTKRHGARRAAEMPIRGVAAISRGRIPRAR